MNFDTDNVVIVAFPTGAGGKFLINCLGISSRCVLQDASFVKQDLSGQLDSGKKFNIIRDRILRIRGYWNDLNFGFMYTGASIEDYRSYYKNNDFSVFDFNPDLEKVINENRLFFLEAHDADDIKTFSKVWPNAKLILFKNCLEFILERNARSDAVEEWNRILNSGECAGLDSWPKRAPLTYYELSTYPDYVQTALETTFKNRAHHERLVDDIEKYKSNNPTYYWDTNFYFSVDETVDGVKKVYEWLGLEDFDSDYIRQYHSLWINKLKEIKLNEKITNNDRPTRFG